jgi:transposase
MKSINQIPFSLPGFEIDEIKQSDGEIEILAHSIEIEAICPTCQKHSSRVHSYYERSPADLPVLSHRIKLQLTVKRFRCQNPNCSKATFVEHWPQLIALNAQRTERLRLALSIIAYAMGGQAGGQLAAKWNMPTSGDTLLRMIRQMPAPEISEPKIIGVDDWAKRRGRLYGTIVVDLERRRIIDLLPDRTAETLSKWLQGHPQIKVVTRDRSREYARGICLGVPQAQQVADRWHLLVNLRDAFIRVLDRLRPELKGLGPSKTTEKADEIPFLRRRRYSQNEVALRDRRRTRRLELYEKVHRLRRAEHTILDIARQLKMSRMTVYRYLSMSQFPEPITHRHRPSILDPYLPHLHQRWQEGCRNASELWREICSKGYPGSRRQVSRWVYERREQPSAFTPAKHLKSRSGHPAFSINEAADQPSLPASQRLVWLFLKHTDQLDLEDLRLRDQLLIHPTLLKTRQLAQEFQRIVREHNGSALDIWLKTCETTDIPELANFATGLRQDYQAVKAGVTLKWSNGQTEGQVNKLKMIKRQMYGRANLDLLRSRLLHPP